MRASPFHSIVACSLVLALGLPSGASAFAPSKKGEASTKDGSADPVPEPASVDGPPRVGRIYVDADALGDAGPVLAGRAMKVAEDGLQGQAVKITDAPAGPELRVVLSLRDSGGYRVEYEIVYDGEIVRDGTGGFDCQLCTEDELVEKVEALAVQVAPKLVVPEPEVEQDLGPGDVTDPHGGGTGDDGGGGGTQDPIRDEETGVLGKRGKIGVALLVVGVVGAGASVPFVVREPTELEDDPTRVRNSRPLGGAALGAGMAVAVVGAVLLALDLRASKNKRSESAAVVHPWVGVGSGGLGVVGRF